MSEPQPELQGWMDDMPRKEVNVWITPTARVKLKLPEGGPPAYVISRLYKIKEGEYMLRPVSLDPHLRPRAGFCRRLGLDISDDTLHRLIKAGFIKARFPSPSLILVNLASLWEHMVACEDPAFWTRDRRLQYLAQLDREAERREQRRAPWFEEEGDQNEDE